MTAQVEQTVNDTESPIAVPMHNRRLGDLGEAITKSALVEKFGEGNIRFNGNVSEGPDYFVELPTLKAAFEVKFWIIGSDIPVDREKYEIKFSGHLRESKKKGYRCYVVFIGKKPVSWNMIAGWSRRSGIIPFYIPVDKDTLDWLCCELDKDSFDVESWANYIYPLVKPTILFYLSIVSGEFDELNQEEKDLVWPIFPENKRIRDIPLFNAFLKTFACGAKLSQIPRELGCPSTVKDRLRQWILDGTWDSAVEAIARHKCPA